MIRYRLMMVVMPAQTMLNRKSRCWRVDGPTILTGLTENSSQFLGRGQPEVVFVMVKAAIVKVHAEPAELGHL